MRYSGFRNLTKLRSLWLNKWNSAGVDDGEISFKEIHALLIKRHRLSISELNKLCYQRYNRTPLQYVIGEWDFRNLTLKTQKPVFIPRPETEQLAGLVIQHINNSKTIDCPVEVLEIGCGTGAISLAISDECRHVNITAIDTNPQACQLARINSKLLNLNINVHEATLNTGGVISGLCIEKQYDVIVSNPPYLTDEEMGNLQPEVLLHEDSLALHGGIDGLDVVKDVLTFSQHNLKHGGVTFMEVGLAHPKMLKELLEKHTYLKFVSSYPDFTERERFVVIQRIL